LILPGGFSGSSPGGFSKNSTTSLLSAADRSGISLWTTPGTFHNRFGPEYFSNKRRPNFAVTTSSSVASDTATGPF
jgi:hypothetical protein